MIKAVVDTNVLVSGVISPKGSPAKVIDLWQKRKFVLVTSEEILKEFRRVLTYPKIAGKYHLDEKKANEYAKGLFAFAQVCSPTRKVSLVKDDPGDDKFIEAALAVGADFIISGDQHLLALREYEGVKILTAGEFLQVCKAD